VVRDLGGGSDCAGLAAPAVEHHPACGRLRSLGGEARHRYNAAGCAHLYGRSRSLQSPGSPDPAAPSGSLAAAILHHAQHLCHLPGLHSAMSTSLSVPQRPCAGFGVFDVDNGEVRVRMRSMKGEDDAVL
jgi:hypothetical protein